MIDAGLRWAGHDPKRLSTLTPYSQPDGVLLCSRPYDGGGQLRPALEHLKACLAEYVPALHLQGVISGDMAGHYGAAQRWKSPAATKITQGLQC